MTITEEAICIPRLETGFHKGKIGYKIDLTEKRTWNLMSLITIPFVIFY